jgi:uncharacterized membrane protein YfcA
MNPDFVHLFCAFAAAFIAAAINSVAGGGSLISFPVLVALGVPAILANATNTVGIWPGAIGSLWGFRAEFAKIPRIYYWLLLPSAFGGIGGALLLRRTSPDFFARIVPGLILFATVMFVVAPSIRDRLRKKSSANPHRGGTILLVILLQTAVSIYGGYFGAGMGILMLSVLSVVGMTDMLEMTAMTSFLSLAINGMAGIVFAFSGLVDWEYAGAMAAGAVLGGYGAAGIARKVGGVWIRRFVITVGLAMAVVMLIRVL